MNEPAPHPYQKAFAGASAVACLHLLLTMVTARRQVENEIEAGNWGYLGGPFVFATLIGTLAAGYWTQRSSKNPSFLRVALRGAAIAFCLLLLQAVGKSVEHQEALKVEAEALVQWKLKPMPVQATWPEGWRVQPVSFNEQPPGFMQEAEQDSAGTASWAALICAYRPASSASSQLDKFLSSAAESLLARFKAEGVEVVSGALGNEAIGAYAGKRLEFHSKDATVALRGEILAADAPACRLIVMAYHIGEPYDAAKKIVDRFKASIK